MERTIIVRVGKKEHEIALEILAHLHSIWQVLSEVKVEGKVWARKGDLIRVSKRTEKGSESETYSVFNLATLRRAEQTHIRGSIASVCRLIDHWSVRLGYIVSLLDNWKQLSEAEREAIREELRDFGGAFYGSKAWQKELALEKVLASTEIRDSLNRPNPQGISRRLASARVHLLEYRRMLDKALSKNALLAVWAESMNADYRRRFGEVRKLVQLGFNSDAGVSERRMVELRQKLSAFTINPWYRPAGEALKYLKTAEGLYTGGDRKAANRVLRMIPTLFSVESRLSRIVEMAHQVLNLGASLDRDGCLLAADKIHPSVEVMRRAAYDKRAVSYGPLAGDVSHYLEEAEYLFRDGRIRLARGYLRQAEIRIRGKEV